MNLRKTPMLLICGAILAGSLLPASVADAAIVTYTNRAAWQAAVAANTTCEDFESEPIAPFGLVPTPYTTNAGVLFDTLTTSVTLQYLDPGLVNSTGELHWRDFQAGVRIRFPDPVCAFGFDYDAGPGPGDLTTVTAGGVPTVLPVGSSGFLGYVEDTGAPIPFVDFVGSPGAQGGISIDDLCWAVCCTECELQILAAVTSDASVTGMCGLTSLETIAENVSTGNVDAGVNITNNGTCDVFLIWWDPVLSFVPVTPGTERRLLVESAAGTSVFGLCWNGTTCDYFYKVF